MSQRHSVVLFAVLGTSLTLTLVALVTSAWECGNLFTDCQETKFRSRMTGIAAFLILAASCFILILIMDVITFCNPPVSANLWFQIAYYALLLLGPMSHLAGVFIYTREIGRQWSYFLAIWASVMAVQAAWFVAFRKTSKRKSVNRTYATSNLNEANEPQANGKELVTFCDLEMANFTL
ncbi:hypothetical protein CSKR_107437 [Clonorchis sinensis]|uniref:Neutral sphingomyelinase n=1 Tax=Clonorchis sinensis TaxID=79923 RepID=A0A3R7CBN6_CLOSI|nr:hypothetical protein CSKR_107437 [Clonorchis sinensis]